MVINNNGIYYHAAYADDEDGAGFSLTEYEGAVYVGNYTDESATESTNPSDYTWQLIGALEEDEDEVESVETSELSDEIADLNLDEVNAKITKNNENLQGTQRAQDIGLGNPNELLGTNQGTDNWTGSSGVSITDATASIYNEDDDLVNYTIITCNTAGSNYALFKADKLSALLATLTSDNSFTLSADVNMSNLISVPVSVANADGTNAQLTFDAIDNSSDIQDNTDTWVFNHSTALVINENDEPVPVSNQAVVFDLSNMAAGDVVMIANLKIEGGALATPWRESLDEVKEIARNAQRVADGVNEHFWYNSTGAHVTEVTQEEYIQDPTNAGGNVIITSQGMGIRDGETELASFTADGIQIGQSAKTHASLDFHSFALTCENETEPYTYLGDLRDTEGVASLKQVFYGDGVATRFAVPVLVADFTSVKINGTEVPASSYVVLGRTILFSTPPSSSDEIIIEYTTIENSTIVKMGEANTTLGWQSYARGESNEATGSLSHAEGRETESNSTLSNAYGYRTKANRDLQTVIGKYNEIDTSHKYDGYGTGVVYTENTYRWILGEYAFIIGNGSTRTRRSNAFAVTWGGEVKLFLNDTATSGTDYEIIQALTDLGWDSECIG